MRSILTLWLLALVGCSGYRFTQQENPLLQYGIHSLSVPMFYNYSSISEVSAPFTRETYRLLTSFSGLKLRSGYDKNADAVLIGIIKSPEKIFETLRPGSPRDAQQVAKDAIGTKRPQFSTPGATIVTLSLQVIVIKKPTEDELALLKSGIGDQVAVSSKVIFNELIPLNSSFTREIIDGQGVDVIATQNAGVQRKAVQTLSRQAAINVRDMILYAF